MGWDAGAWLHYIYIYIQADKKAINPYQYEHHQYNNDVKQSVSYHSLFSLHLVASVMSGPLFAKRVDVSSQNFVKPRNREIGSYDDRIALTFIRHLDSSAVETSVNFQSGWKSFNPNLATSRLHEILRWDGLPLDTVIKSGHECLTLNSTAPKIEMWIHQELKNDKNENLMLILDNYGHSVELLFVWQRGLFQLSDYYWGYWNWRNWVVATEPGCVIKSCHFSTCTDTGTLVLSWQNTVTSLVQGQGGFVTHLTIIQSKNNHFPLIIWYLLRLQGLITM